MPYRSNDSGGYVFVQAALGGASPEAAFPSADYDYGSICWDRTGRVMYVCVDVGAGVHGWDPASSLHAGSGLLDFATSRSNTTLTVTGQPAISANSRPVAVVPYAATADHSADEHAIAPIYLRCGNIVPGVGFDIVAVSDWVLSGTFNVQWTW